MKKSWLFAAALVLAAIAGHSWAGDLPMPAIEKSDPAKIYPGEMKIEYGQIRVHFIGHDLGPNDGDNGHPAGADGGYQHIFIRAMSAASVPGVWVECRAPDCIPLGSTGVDRTDLNLGFSPKIVSAPGSWLQIKLWVSMGATAVSDPKQSPFPSSDWSDVYSLPIAKAGEHLITATATATTGSSSSSSSTVTPPKPVYRKATIVAPHLQDSASSSAAQTSATGSVHKTQTHTPG